jgi:propionyl-CoA synthetase
MESYRAMHDASIRDPEGFWLDAAKAIDWSRPPTYALERSRDPFFSWFRDGELNTCHNALGRHVAAGHGDRRALVYDSPVTGRTATWTYDELLTRVASVAGVLRDTGVARGDRVVIYMPMVPEAVVAMLACARLGAVHSVVFGGFAPNEFALRIDDARPKVIVSASCGIEVARVVEYKPSLDRALELAQHQPERCIILQRPEAHAELTSKDLDWDRAIVGVGASRVRRSRGDRPAVHPLHVRHHRKAEGCSRRQWRLRRRLAVEHAQHLRRGNGSRWRI